MIQKRGLMQEGDIASGRDRPPWGRHRQNKEQSGGECCRRLLGPVLDGHPVQDKERREHFCAGRWVSRRDARREVGRRTDAEMRPVLVEGERAVKIVGHRCDEAVRAVDALQRCSAEMDAADGERRCSQSMCRLSARETIDRYVHRSRQTHACCSKKAPSDRGNRAAQYRATDLSLLDARFSH